MALTWIASTDAVGVAVYYIERCQDAGCTTITFARVGSVTGAPPVTTYTDSNLTPSSSYGYRIQAADAAGNLSLYSNITGSAVIPSCD